MHRSRREVATRLTEDCLVLNWSSKRPSAAVTTLTVVSAVVIRVYNLSAASTGRRPGFDYRRAAAAAAGMFKKRAVPFPVDHLSALMASI